MMLQYKNAPPDSSMHACPCLRCGSTNPIIFGESNVEHCGAMWSNAEQQGSNVVLCLGVLAPFAGCVEHESKRGHAALKSLHQKRSHSRWAVRRSQQKTQVPQLCARP